MPRSWRVRAARKAAKIDRAASFFDVPYVTNAGGRLVRRGALIEDDLYASLQKPVLLRYATEALYETGVKCFVEMLPGRALRDLARAAFPDVVAIALDGSTIDDVRALSLQDASRR